MVFSEPFTNQPSLEIEGEYLGPAHLTETLLARPDRTGLNEYNQQS